MGPSSSSDALTTIPNAALVTITAGSATPWCVLASGNGRWWACPLPPATTVDPHRALEFLISNLVVNEASGTAEVKVFESAGEENEGRVPVKKTVPVDHGGEAPTIINFTVHPVEAARGADVTISWKAQNAVSGVLLPDGTPLPDPNEGAFARPLNKTTVFTLELAGKGGTTRQVKTATVMPVRIEKFAAKPSTPVKPNDAVTLEFDTAFATQVSIDQGVGIVPRSGHVVVHPTQTTVYTLTASGLDVHARAVEVVVQT
jgi:hypothetical protein